MTGWQSAQVIEATTPRGEREALRPEGNGWRGCASDVFWGSAGLSDVRVIVDAEGKVVPPEITDDEVREFLRNAYPFVEAAEQLSLTGHLSFERALEGLLTAALGGERP